MKAVAVAVLFACACRPQVLSSSDQTAIHKVLDEQRDAWNRGDVEAFMNGYQRSEEIVFTSGGKVRHGFEETLASYRSRYADDNAMGHLEFTEIEIQELGTEAAVVLGHWELTDTPQAGGGVFSLVFLRDGTSWRIVHDHSSSYAKGN